MLKAVKNEVYDFDIDSLKLLAEQITPVVIYTSSYIEKAIFNQSNETNYRQYKIAQLNILLLRGLVFLYTHLMKNCTKSSEKALFGNISMQLISRVFYQYALSYEKTSAIVWTMMGEVYSQGKEANILDLNVSIPIPGLKKITTISDALKRNLVFIVGNYGFLTHEQIKCYFEFCELNSPLLVLKKSAIKIVMASTGNMRLLFNQSRLIQRLTKNPSQNLNWQHQVNAWSLG